MDRRTYLAHFGIKGQKWGIRRYQNEDGSLTNAGRAHYGYGKVQGSIWSRGKTAIQRIRLKKEARKAKKNEARKAKKNEADPRTMDYATLQNKVNRMRLEQEYIKRYAELNPQKQTRVKEILKKTFNKTVDKLSDETADAVAKSIAKKFKQQRKNNE